MTIHFHIEHLIILDPIAASVPSLSPSACRLPLLELISDDDWMIDPYSVRRRTRCHALRGKCVRAVRREMRSRRRAVRARAPASRCGSARSASAYGAAGAPRIQSSRAQATRHAGPAAQYAATPASWRARGKCRQYNTGTTHAYARRKMRAHGVRMARARAATSRVRTAYTYAMRAVCVQRSAAHTYCAMRRARSARARVTYVRTHNGIPQRCAASKCKMQNVKIPVHQPSRTQCAPPQKIQNEEEGQATKDEDPDPRFIANHRKRCRVVRARAVCVARGKGQKARGARYGAMCGGGVSARRARGVCVCVR